VSHNGTLTSASDRVFEFPDLRLLVSMDQFIYSRYSETNSQKEGYEDHRKSTIIAILQRHSSCAMAVDRAVHSHRDRDGASESDDDAETQLE
jgi:hypothetical protein